MHDLDENTVYLVISTAIIALYLYLYLLISHAIILEENNNIIEQNQCGLSHNCINILFFVSKYSS